MLFGHDNCCDLCVCVECLLYECVVYVFECVVYVLFVFAILWSEFTCCKLYYENQVQFALDWHLIGTVRVHIFYSQLSLDVVVLQE